MPAEACSSWRADLASAAIGRLEPAEHTRLLAHLDGCAACRQTLAELEQTAQLVQLADVEHVAGDDEPTLPPLLGDAIVARLRTEQAREQRRRSHRTRALLAAAAALVLVVAIAVGLLASRGSHAATEQVALSGDHISATAKLVDDESGTEVHLSGRGVDPKDVYWMWLTGPDGKRVGAGTFNGGTTGRFDVSTYCALPYDMVRRVWITDARDHVVLDAWVQPA